jgi:transposase
MRRHELSDAQFKLIEPFLPVAEGAGHPWNPHWPLLNGIFWRLRTGTPWRDLPARYGPWQTVYDRYVRFRRDGTWARILQALQVKLDVRGEIDWDQWSLDSTNIRASRAAAGARKKGGLTATNQPITL